ncbi:ester cyclase [Streptomyces sp. NPDC093109]|uniref:ester cyclase n=1 Tax=Streptomyces sp. NPDC093109 TaxID=3154977 RepID=UPI0034504973
MTDNKTAIAAATAATATATTRRRRARLLIPAALAVLALTATATVTANAASNAASSSSKTTHVATAQQMAGAQEHRGGAKQLKPKAMLDSWLRLWNGDYTQAQRIVSPDFRIHAAMMDGSDSGAIRGPEGVVGWIAQTRAAFPDMRFSMEVRPLIDGAYASVRWTVTGTYAGGFPGAKAEPGTVVTFTGTDTLRMKNGKFVEYWVNSDTLDLLTQLKVG